MQNLHLFPCTIRVLDQLNYQLNVDTTSMGVFAANSAIPVQPFQYIGLQVGTGNDRTTYPIQGTGPGLPFGFFGSNLSVNSYYTFHFDKTISGQTDGSGNPVPGVWMVGGNPGAHNGDVPVEICTTLINELNAMSPAHPIGMWLNIPVYGLSSMDPDYTTASDWTINCLDTVLNPSSSVRTSGYSALGYSGATKLYNLPLVVEYANENWNGGGGIIQRPYLAAKGIQRWPTIYPYQDFQDMQSLRTTCMARDAKAALSSLLTNTKFLIGLQGDNGWGSNPGNNNYSICFNGNVSSPPNPIFSGDWYINDSLVTSGGWGTAISNHDGVCPAHYFDPPNYYMIGMTGTGSFVDDVALYFGTDNSGTLSMTGGTSTTTISATFSTGTMSISATNTLAAGQAITFATTVGNIIAGTTYYVQPQGLSGSAFQISNVPFNTNLPITPSTAGSSLATPSALTITPVVNQILVAIGIPTNAYVVSVSGTSPNYTLGLSAIATVSPGTTITSPAPLVSWSATIAGTTMTLTSAATGGSPNRGQPFTGAGVTAGTFIIALLTGLAGASGSTYSINQSQTISSPTAMSNTGGNYVGAANQSQAISNFINRVADSAGLFPNDQTMFHYSNLRYPAIATGIGLTKVLMSYEGSQDWVTGIGAANTAGFNNTYQQALFQLAALNSSQFGTALTGFFNTICAIPNIFAPANYLFIIG